MVLAIYQFILHLNKITECLKMTTFKIVFTFDVFLSAETTMHCKVICILYHISALFLLYTKTDDAILLTAKLPDNREYIKIQEWL
jgi:hypothetical protein